MQAQLEVISCDMSRIGEIREYMPHILLLCFTVHTDSAVSYADSETIWSVTEAQKLDCSWERPLRLGRARFSSPELRRGSRPSILVFLYVQKSPQPLHTQTSVRGYVDSGTRNQAVIICRTKGRSCKRVSNGSRS